MAQPFPHWWVQRHGDGATDTVVQQASDLSGTRVGAPSGSGSVGRCIAQASQAQKESGYGVFDAQAVRVEGGSGQNLGDSSGPSRDVDNMCEGKPGVGNVCRAKGRKADCIAIHTWMLIGLHFWETRQMTWITWEVPGYTLKFVPLGVCAGGHGMGDAQRLSRCNLATSAGLMSRFKRFEQELSCERRRPGRRGTSSVVRAESRHRLKGVPLVHLGSSARAHGSNAEHQDAKGWPPDRQQLHTGDSVRDCGQKCTRTLSCSHHRAGTDGYCSPTLGLHNSFNRCRDRRRLLGRPKAAHIDVARASLTIPHTTGSSW